MTSTPENQSFKQNAPIQRRKRSKYSRNGCLECKRMKVKCDESKPSCGRCYRSSKTCNYVTIPLKLEAKSNNAAPLPPSNMMESIDLDMASRIDDILNIEKNLDDLNVTLSPLHESELYSQIDTKSLSLLHSYDDFSKTVSKSNDLLFNDSVWSIPREVFTAFKELSHKCYFDIFYDQFSQIVMPMKSDRDTNPVRDILLSYAFRKDYLYYAILASGARLSYKGTLLEDDQHHYSVFMKRTSRMLNDFTFLQEYKPDSHSLDVVNQRLEPLLLTILLLTSDNAASLEQSWRGHLRGAKELLHKVFVDKLFPETKILIFCKCWFTSFEVLAGLGAPYGGTLVKEKEIEKLVMNVDCPYEVSALRSLNIVDESNYNYLLGFHNSLLPPLLTLINKMRSILKDESGVKSYQVFALISEFQKQANLKRDSAWQSVSHHCYADAAVLTILSKFLEVPISNSVVQELVHNILNSLHELLSNKSSTPYELLLLHWPVLVAGLNCVTEEDKYVIEKLFRLLASLGTGSAKHALDKIKKTWNHEQTTDAEVDVVTY